MRTFSIEPLESRIAPATITVAPQTVTEGDSASKTFNFTVSLADDATADAGTTFHYELVSGTGAHPGIGGTDFVAASGDITFAAGSKSVNIPITINGDTAEGNDRTFTVRLSNPVGADFGDAGSTAEAAVTILDDDHTVSFAAASRGQSVAEGNSGTTTVTYTVNLSSAADHAINVNFSTVDGTAVSTTDAPGRDFNAAIGNLTFEAGVTSKTFTVDILGDTTQATFGTTGNGDESFGVKLEIPTGTAAKLNSASGAANTSTTILNDDGIASAPVTLSVQDATAPEGGSAQFVFTLSSLTESPVSVSYATQGGTGTNPAVENTDYTSANGTLTFNGELTKTVSVATTYDSVGESTEQFQLNLSNAVNATLAADHATGSITNVHTIGVSSATVLEGDTADQTYHFTVTLDSPADSTVSFQYALQDGTAKAGTHYETSTGTVTFEEGATTASFDITLHGNTTVDTDHSFNVLFSNPTNATFASGAPTATAAVTILDDDSVVSFTHDSLDQSFAEGAQGEVHNFTYTVNLSAVSSHPITVNYSTKDLTAISTANAPGRDYNAASGALTFQPGETSKTITVQVLGDAIAGPDETFQLNLTAADGTPFGAKLDSVHQTVTTILNDDGNTPFVPKLSVANVTGTEGGNAVFTFTLDGLSESDVTVDYGTTDGITNAAQEGADYTATHGTVKISGGLSATVSVPLAIDQLAEVTPEQFLLNLSNAHGATLGNFQATGFIANPSLGLKISDVVVREGREGTSTAIFTITLDQAVPAGSAVVLNYHTSDLPAGSTAATSDPNDPHRDYLAASGTLTFAAGTRTQTVAVQINGDQVLEANELFNFTLDGAKVYPATSSPDAAGLYLVNGQASGVVHGTILNDEPSQITVNVSAGSTTLNEGAADSTAKADFVLTLSGAIDHDVTVPYTLTTTDVTGVKTTVDKTVVIPAFTLSVPVEVDFTKDGVVGHDQVLTVQLKTPPATPAGTSANFVLGASKTATTTILDDDAVLIVVPKNGDGVIPEGNSGTKPLPFLIKLVDPADPTKSVKVDHAITGTFKTVDSTVAGSGFTATGSGQFADFAGGSDTFSLNAGENELTINVGVRGDTLPGADETFGLQVATAQGAQISATKGTGVGTIQNDDGAAPTITVGNATGIEGGNAVFAVSLSKASDTPVTFIYKADVDGSGAAAAATDFTAATGTVTIPAGATTGQISVPLTQDTLNEGDETFSLTLSEAANGTLVNTTAVGHIAASDQPVVTVQNVRIVEGAAGAGSTLKFTVTLDAVTDVPVTFNYTTQDLQTAGQNAVAGSDYTAVSMVGATIPAGQQTLEISVPITGDDVNEADEAFSLVVSNLAHATFANNKTSLTALGTIGNDDAHYTITSSDANGVTEGAKFATFKVTRDVSGFEGTVDYTTVAGTAVSTGATPDFTAQTGTIHFAANETEKTILVPVLDDDRYEGDQQFTLQLSNPTGGVFPITDPVSITLSAGVTIHDNDHIPKVSISAPKPVIEGDSGTSNMVFTISLDRPNDQGEVKVNFSTADGTAVAGHDYEAQTGTVTFAVGETTQTVTVKVTNDLVFDSAKNETLKLNLTLPTPAGGAPAGATFGFDSDGQAIATLSAMGVIVDNDAAPMITLTAGSVAEGGTGGVTATLSHPSDNPVTVKYYTVDGTATSLGANNDFTGVDSRSAQVLTFGALETSKVIPIATVDDDVTEGNESFKVQLVSPTGATLSRTASSAVATITDNDQAVITINDVTIVEGDDGTKDAVFTVSMVGKTQAPVTVDFSTIDGTAKSGSDFLASAGKLTLVPDAGGASASGQIVVKVLGDLGKETDETFSVKLANPTLGTLSKDIGTGTIQNGTDTATVLSVNDVTVVEGTPTSDSSGAVTSTKTMTFTASLSAASTEAVTFAVNVEQQARLGNMARAGSDYVVPHDPANAALPLTVTIPAGSTSATFSITVNEDAVFEATEFFNVRLSNITGAQPGDVVGTGTIYDDDLFVSGKTAKWTDVDGDLVTLQVSKGKLSPNQLFFLGTGDVAIGSLGGRTLSQLDLVDSGRMFQRANITVTSTPQPDASGAKVGNGRVDIGYIRANNVVGATSPLETIGIDLGTVKVNGDVSRIDAGDLFSDRGIARLDVYSLGVNSVGTEGNIAGGGIFLSNILAGAGTIKTTQDIQGTIQVSGGVTGVIGNLSIGGALKGGAAASSGRIITTGAISHVTIHDIIGGSGDLSGSISSFDSTSSIGSVKILGSIVEGTATDSDHSAIRSGSIIAPKIGSVSIGDSMHGGQISASSSLGPVTVTKDMDSGAVVLGGGLANGHAIRSVVVHGNVNDAKILGGYSTSNATTPYDPLNADAQIDYVQVDGSVANFDVLAGVQTGGAPFTTNVVNSPTLFSRIAQVVFNGTIVPNTTGSHYVAAQEVDSLVVDNVAKAISASQIEVVAGTNFFVKLVG